MSTLDLESPEVRGTYSTPINYAVEDGLNDPVIKDALKLIMQNFTEKNKRDIKNQMIADMFEEGFIIKQPFGPKKINCKKLIQSLWCTLPKLKLPDFTMHGLEAQDWEETLVSDGYSTILDRADYYATFRDKMGVAMNMLLYGDGFRMLGKMKEKGFPFKFQTITPTNIYVNTQSTALRKGNKPATKMAVVFSGTWDQFISYFPDMKGKAGMGRIPRQVSYYKELDQTYVQRIKQDNKITEWCYYWDIEHKVYSLFVGSKCTVIESKVGDEYPFTYEDSEGIDTPYIPVFQYCCMPAAEGFYNHGIGEMIYDLAQLYTGIMNQMGQSIEDNVYGLDFLSVPNGEEAKVFEKMQMAYQERALGRRALIPLGYSEGAPNDIKLQTIQSVPLVNEAITLFNLIDTEFKRLGIYLDDAERTANTTATEILSDIDRRNEFTKQIMEYNSTEMKCELQAVLQLTKDFVKTTDKTSLDVTTRIRTPDGQEYRADFLTMGLLSKTLKERHWFFRVNDKSGVSYSSMLKRAQLTEMLQYLQPGTPEFVSIIKELAALNDITLDIAPPQQIPQQGTQGQPQQGGAPIGPQVQQMNQSPEAVSRQDINFRTLSKA